MHIADEPLCCCDCIVVHMDYSCPEKEKGSPNTMRNAMLRGLLRHQALNTSYMVCGYSVSPFLLISILPLFSSILLLFRSCIAKLSLKTTIVGHSVLLFILEELKCMSLLYANFFHLIKYQIDQNNTFRFTSSPSNLSPFSSSSPA